MKWPWTRSVDKERIQRAEEVARQAREQLDAARSFNLAAAELTGHNVSIRLHNHFGQNVEMAMRLKRRRQRRERLWPH